VAAVARVNSFSDEARVIVAAQSFTGRLLRPSNEAPMRYVNYLEGDATNAAALRNTPVDRDGRRSS